MLNINPQTLPTRYFFQANDGKGHLSQSDLAIEVGLPP